MFEEGRERLQATQETTHRSRMEMFNIRKLNEVAGKERYQVEISNRFVVLGILVTKEDINRVWETIGENINICTKESLGYFELKKRKPRFDEGCSESLGQRKLAKLQ
jgi:hypothetical protein